MKNVLVPLDFDNDARKVLKDLLSLLQGMEGDLKIFLLDTYMVPSSPSGHVIHAHDELRRRSLERLQEYLNAAKELLGDRKVSFEAVSQMGTPANVISRVVKERDIDCVVLGVGQKQEEIVNLLNRLHCPMVVLPSQAVP